MQKAAALNRVVYTVQALITTNIVFLGSLYSTGYLTLKTPKPTYPKPNTPNPQILIPSRAMGVSNGPQHGFGNCLGRYSSRASGNLSLQGLGLWVVDVENSLKSGQCHALKYGYGYSKGACTCMVYTRGSKSLHRRFVLSFECLAHAAAP